MSKKNTVSKEQLQTWRRQHEALFQLSDGETDYYVRPLTFKEHEEARALSDRGLNAMAEEFVLLQTVIHPEIDADAIDNMPAGIARMVEEILELSAFINPEESSKILREAREDTQNDLWTAAAAFVIVAIPSMTLDDLRDMGMRRLMEHVAIAEHIFQLDHELRRGEMPQLVLHEAGNAPQQPQPPQEQRGRMPQQPHWPSSPPPTQQREQSQEGMSEEERVLQEMREKMSEAEQYL